MTDIAETTDPLAAARSAFYAARTALSSEIIRSLPRRVQELLVDEDGQPLDLGRRIPTELYCTNAYELDYPNLRICAILDQDAHKIEFDEEELEEVVNEIESDLDLLAEINGEDYWPNPDGTRFTLLAGFKAGDSRECRSCHTPLFLAYDFCPEVMPEWHHIIGGDDNDGRICDLPERTVGWPIDDLAPVSAYADVINGDLNMLLALRNNHPDMNPRPADGEDD